MVNQIGVRVSEAERRKLEALARSTGRNLSEVVRLLIRNARTEARPDISTKEVKVCERR